MNQTKLGSLIEACFSTFIGFFVATVSQVLIFPLFGINVPLSTNLGIGACFTIISVVRSYIIRRWFNHMLKTTAEKWAAQALKENHAEVK